MSKSKASKGNGRVFHLLRAINAYALDTNGEQTPATREGAGFIPAAQHPANQDRRAFLVWSERDGMWVVDSSAACAGVHDNGFETEAEFIAWWMGEGKE